MRVTFWHEPEDFAFYIQNPSRRERLGPSVSRDLGSSGVAVRPGVIVVRVESELDPVAVTVEFDDGGVMLEGLRELDSLVTAEMDVGNDGLCFETASGLEFGHISLPRGRWEVGVYRVFPGTLELGAGGNEHYLVRVSEIR